MNTDELERLLEAGVETQRVDFKGPCSWEVLTYAKDILALSNVGDGGYLVVGVDEKDAGFVRTGIYPTQKASFDIDRMKDQMSAFADPHVDFRVHYPRDKDGREYVVIEVMPFDEVPVICRKESADTHVGTVYYRNRNRRVESAPVSNSNDMRDIIERASVQTTRRLHGLGLSAGPSAKKILDDELEGL